MYKLLSQRSATVSNSMDFDPSGGPRAAIRSSSTVQRVAVCRPESGKAAAPETARRARSGARLVRALAAVCLILLGTFANALPAQSQAPATKPSAPQELTAIASAGQVDLAWSAPANNGSSAILRYEVRGGRGTTVPDDRTWRSTGLGRTHVYGALTNGALYTFEVRAVNGEGDGSVAQIQATPATVPAAPHTLSATPAASRLVLRWSAPANASTSAIVRYEVRHAEGATVPANAAWTSAGLATTYNFTNLSNGRLHTFEVRAANEDNQGPAAQIQGTPGVPPTAPQELTARASAAQVALAWSAPADDGGSELLRYEIRKRPA